MMIRILLLSFILSFSARIKDVAHLKGLESHDLIGYGLVVGLKGTGDGPQTGFTTQSVINMLRNLGIEVPGEQIRTRNVAAVMVTGKINPFEKVGSRIDVSLSSMGDARSIEGGTLLMTPMQGPEGTVFALAQGAIATGGYLQLNNKGQKSRSKNQVLAANIPNGAKILKEPNMAKVMATNLEWVLEKPDFSSAQGLASSLNSSFGEGTAEVEDASSIKVKLPAGQKLMPFIASMEQVTFIPNMRARVILNEKTGTVVAGANVQISSVAIAHGSIQLNISSQTEVSQPNALAGGNTESFINEQVKGQETQKEMTVLPSISNVGDLATNLNSLGLAPRDIISIFQAIQKAGALHADIEMM